MVEIVKGLGSNDYNNLKKIMPYGFECYVEGFITFQYPLINQTDSGNIIQQYCENHLKNNGMNFVFIKHL